MKPNEFVRGAGILLSIGSLPSDYGIGTLGKAAYEFIDLLVDLRQRYWQILPIGPTSYGDSPYLTISAFAGNPYYIDLELLIDDELLHKEDIMSFQWSQNKNDIDYGTLFHFRFKVLEIAFRNFDVLNCEFENFCKEQEWWLNDYSLFMALKKEFLDNAWNLWPEDIVNRKEDSISHYCSILSEEILFWKFCQYKFYQQWNQLRDYATKKGIQIIGDIPFYVAYDSVDVWVHKQYFQLNKYNGMDFVAGCPPDLISDETQVWGNPLYNWSELENNFFDWWGKRILHNTTLFDVIRLDHFIGLTKYYVIELKNNTPIKGKWEKGPGKKLVDIIQDNLNECKIIAEDLGANFPASKKMLEKLNWPGMKVLLFAFDGNTNNEYLPNNYSNHNVVLYGATHDNETIEGFFCDKTEYELAYLYEYLNISTKDEIVDAMIRLGYSSIADIVIFQMQDLLKLDNSSRMNLPATVGRNWRWRLWRDSINEERRTLIRTMSMVYRR